MTREQELLQQYDKSDLNIHQRHAIRVLICMLPEIEKAEAEGKKVSDHFHELIRQATQ